MFYDAVFTSDPPRMQANRTHYELLGVPKDATPEAIERVWRRMRAEFQRETAVPDPRAEALARNAYETLSDPFRRAAYDEWLRSPKAIAQRTRDKLRSRNGLAAVGVLLAAVGAALWWYAADPPAPRGPTPQAIVTAAAHAVGRLSVIDVEGHAKPVGLAFAIAPGRLAASCHGLAPHLQLVVDFGQRRMPARVARADPRAGLCVLAAEGLGSWPLEFGIGPPNAGETVYLAEANAAGEASLVAGRVRRVVHDDSGDVIEASIRIPAGAVGGPLFDAQGRVVAVADAQGRNRAIPDAWIEEARGPLPEPAKPPSSPQPEADEAAPQPGPAPGALEPTVRSNNKLIEELSKARAVPKDL